MTSAAWKALEMTQRGSKRSNHRESFYILLTGPVWRSRHDDDDNNNENLRHCPDWDFLISSFILTMFFSIWTTANNTSVCDNWQCYMPENWPNVRNWTDNDYSLPDSNRITFSNTSSIKSLSQYLRLCYSRTTECLPLRVLLPMTLPLIVVVPVQWQLSFSDT